MNAFLKTYADAVRTLHKTGSATEHTYRGALAALLDALLPHYHAVNEPKHTECGAPDYALVGRRDRIPHAYIEAKDLFDGDLLGLKPKQNKPQFDRYKAALARVAFTDYLTFHFFANGEKSASVALLEPDGKGGFTTNDTAAAQFIAALTDWADCPMQPITTPSRLAEIMAEKAKLLKDATAKVLAAGSPDDPDDIRSQFEAFKRTLIHDLAPEDFADIYAQTIAYGMFAARLNDDTPEDFSRQEAATLIPHSNPFLRKLFQQIAGYDLDRRIAWIIDDLADAFAATDIHKVMGHYRTNALHNDPMIHFYEDFLASYDPKKRKQCGVYYTPQSVVKFIVRAVDDVLKRDFGLADGLADSSRINPSGSSRAPRAPGRHRVQILDPATGTGTFLAETVRVIKEKFADNEGMWPGYVKDDLKPRLHGFELMMAPYTIAHLKLGMALGEAASSRLNKKDTYSSSEAAGSRFSQTGSRFSQRIRVYLTNSLEESHPDADTLWGQWLSAESNEASAIKRDTPVMVMMGNPPYSGESQNRGDWIMRLMEDYKKEPGGKVRLAERNSKWINDDYVKFIRLAQHYIDRNQCGVIGFISNNGYLDNPTFRGMRWNLLKSFDDIYVVNLHGNSAKKETAPDGGKDENVFDITVGTAIVIFVKRGKKGNELARVHYLDLWGKRKEKYAALEALVLPKETKETTRETKPPASCGVDGTRETKPPASYNGKDADSLLTKPEASSPCPEASSPWLEASSPWYNPEGEVALTHGNLPHWHQAGKIQFVTFRLADSLPQNKLESMMAEREDWINTHPKPWDEATEEEYHTRFSQAFDRWLDAGYGSCALKDPAIAKIVEDALLFFDGQRYRVHDYVVMSNHVHVLLETANNWRLEDILRSWKTFTAREINKRCGQSGKFWHHESFDRMIRDAGHYCRVRAYIQKNVRQGGVLYFKETKPPASCAVDGTRETKPPASYNGKDANSPLTKPEASFPCLEASFPWQTLAPKAPYYFFVPKDMELEREYNRGIPITELFPVNSMGVTTGNDTQLVDFTGETFPATIENFDAGFVKDYLYRPFDIRKLYYKPDLLARARAQFMQSVTDGENIALLLCRQLSTGAFRHVLVTDLMSDNSTVSTASKERSYHLPLYRYEETLGQVVKVSNLNLDVVRRAGFPVDCFQKNKRIKGAEDEKNFSFSSFPSFLLLSKNKSASSAGDIDAGDINLIPEEFFAYCYAVLHSPTYRERYKEFLKIDFPRIPMPWDWAKQQHWEKRLPAALKGDREIPFDKRQDAASPVKRQDAASPKQDADSPSAASPSVYRRLVALGRRLIDLHLMRVDFPNDALPNFPIIGSNIVEEVRWETGRVYINATQYFDRIPESSYTFFIGGYQPAQKWLKDRKGRTLTNADLTHYRRLIATLSATAAIMDEIG